MSDRRWAARAWWLAGLVVLAVAMVGVPALGASAPGDGGVRADGDSGPFSDRVLRDAERSVAEARLKRDAADSAAGRAERAASAAKYGDLSGAEALAVDRRELGEVFAVRPSDPLGSVSGERVQRLNDFSALLDGGDGRKRLLEANLPVSVLQGGRRVRVSLKLEDRGDTHAPESPASVYEVADDPGRGVSLSDAGVRVSSDLGSGLGAEVVDGRVFGLDPVLV